MYIYLSARTTKEFTYRPDLIDLELQLDTPNMETISDFDHSLTTFLSVILRPLIREAVGDEIKPLLQIVAGVQQAQQNALAKWENDRNQARVVWTSLSRAGLTLT